MKEISMQIATVDPDDGKSGPKETAPGAAAALARRFVELMLADGTGGKSAVAALPRSFEVTDLSEFGLDLDETDERRTDRAERVPTLSVDEAAAAVLLASQFAANPAILRALRRDSPVVVFDLPDEDLGEPVAEVLQACVLGRSVKVFKRSRSGRSNAPLDDADGRSAAIVDCNVSGRSERKMLDRWVSEALSQGIPVCAVSTDADRNVPAPCRTVADAVLRLGGLTGETLTVLIQAVAGGEVEISAEPWIPAIGMQDLRMSISPNRGAAASLLRLKETVVRRLEREIDLPSLEDLHGYGKAKDVALAMIDDLTAYRNGEIRWNEVDRGMVLAGPPGCGKTMFAKVFAKSADLPLVVASLAQWQSSGTGHLGDCLSAMRATFGEARSRAPCVLFVDELDSFGDRATFAHAHRDYSMQVVNCFLELLDGANDRTGVVVLGATNNVGFIDPAILRPGRLDRVVDIELPDPVELRGIFRTQLGGELGDADLAAAATAGRGGSGADVANWVRRARSTARRSRREMRLDDLIAAVREGRQALEPEFKERIALHEAGHATAAIALGMGKVTSITCHDFGGTTWIADQPRATTRARAISSLVYLLAGRAAEMVFLGDASSGAGGSSTSDLALATRIAAAVEGSWGLGSAGPIWLGDPDSFVRFAFAGSGTAGPVAKLLCFAEKEAAELMRANLPAVRRCADRLLSEGYLDAPSVAEAIGIVPAFEIGTTETEVPDAPASDLDGRGDSRPKRRTEREAGATGDGR